MTISMRILIAFAAIAATGCAGRPAAGPSPVDPVAGERQKLVIERIRSGPQGTLADSTRLVIRDGRTWNRYRQGVVRDGQSGYDVDFDARMVVLVALGRQTKTCCTIRVDSAIATSTELSVFLTKSRLGDGCVVAAAVTNPFDAVRLPKRTSPVRFVEHDVVTNCRRGRSPREPRPRSLTSTGVTARSPMDR